MSISTARTLTSSFGRRYDYLSILQRKSHSECVWLAQPDRDLCVLKKSPATVFDKYVKNLNRIPQHNNIRRPYDLIPDACVAVYQHLRNSLWNFPVHNQPIQQRTRILKNVLNGLAALHSKDIVHLDIKLDNVLINSRSTTGVTEIDLVQIIDFENSVHLHPGRNVKGVSAGNENWRCPEAHFLIELSTPADIFSFGAVCIYVVLGRIVFGMDDDFEFHLKNGALPSMIRLQRAVSYFGTTDGVDGLLYHITDDKVNTKILEILWEERAAVYIPYEHFKRWNIDPYFRDFALRIMDLDPKQRLTAHEALEQSWLSSVGI